MSIAPRANEMGLTITWKRLDGRPCGPDAIAEALETELDGYSFDVETPDGEDMSVYEIASIVVNGPGR